MIPPKQMVNIKRQQVTANFGSTCQISSLHHLRKPYRILFTGLWRIVTKHGSEGKQQTLSLCVLSHISVRFSIVVAIVS